MTLPAPAPAPVPLRTPFCPPFWLLPLEGGLLYASLSTCKRLLLSEAAATPSSFAHALSLLPVSVVSYRGHCAPGSRAPPSLLLPRQSEARSVPQPAHPCPLAPSAALGAARRQAAGGRPRFAAARRPAGRRRAGGPLLRSSLRPPTGLLCPARPPAVPVASATLPVHSCGLSPLALTISLPATLPRPPPACGITLATLPLLRSLSSLATSLPLPPCPARVAPASRPDTLAAPPHSASHSIRLCEPGRPGTQPPHLRACHSTPARPPTHRSPLQPLPVDACHLAATPSHPATPRPPCPEYAAAPHAPHCHTTPTHTLTLSALRPHLVSGEPRPPRWQW